MSKKIFLDMDFTLAIFPVKHGEQGTQRYKTQEGFFSKLKPYKNVEMVNNAVAGGNVDTTYILSNSPTEQADSDKEAWLDKYLSAIPKENRIFNRGGLTAEKTKAEVAVEILGRELTPDDILIDDTVKNLIEWEEAGGTAIRKHNRNYKVNWNGKHITRMTTLAKLIQSA